MTPAEYIIGKFGGIAATARALGHKNASTVQGWKERGLIPARQQALVLEAARREGKCIGASDFIEPPTSPGPDLPEDAAA